MGGEGVTHGQIDRQTDKSLSNHAVSELERYHNSEVASLLDTEREEGGGM